MAADELLDAKWADWGDGQPGRLSQRRGEGEMADDGGVGAAEMLAVAGQAAAGGEGDVGGDVDGATERPPATGDFGEAEPVACLIPTAVAVPYRKRRTLDFFERCAVTLDDGAGELPGAAHSQPHS